MIAAALLAACGGAPADSPRDPGGGSATAVGSLSQPSAQSTLAMPLSIPAEAFLQVGDVPGTAKAKPDRLGAARDGNLDVRRAAVRSLAGWADRDDVAGALRAAGDDPDADVRAYARRALTNLPSRGI